jgi:hypothetical protein
MLCSILNIHAAPNAEFKLCLGSKWADLPDLEACICCLQITFPLIIYLLNAICVIHSNISLCLQLTKFVFGTIFLRESWPCLTVWFLPAHSTFFLQLLHFHFSNLFMRILEPRKWTLYTNDNLFALLKCWFHIIVMMTFISVFGWEKPNLGGKKTVQIENWILEPV